MDNEIVRFSSSALLYQWAKEKGLPTEKRTPAKVVKTGKRTRAEKQAQKSDGRKYKGISGRISKNGAGGWFDVDERGRFICV